MASRPVPTASPAAPAPASAAPAIPPWDDSWPFPIEDYDDLRVVEIIALLPELDDQELAHVQEFEQANRKRLAIISRIDALLADSAAAAPPPPPQAADEGTDAVEEVAVPSAEGLPIADYDFLGVSELLPLLAELDDDELEEVRDYEQSARGRATVLYRIDVLLEAAAAAATEAASEPPPEPSEPEATEPAPAAAEAEGPALPIANYERLRVFQILTLLAELDDDELQAVRDHEQAGRGRITILNEIDARLAGGGPAEPEAEPSSEAAAPEPSPPEPEPAPAPSVAEEEDATGLPIADYDALTQFEIVPLLDELYDDELDLVRDYEDAHRARAAILFRIDALLAPEEPEPAGEEAGAEPEAEAEPATDAEPATEAEPEPLEVEEPAEAEQVWGELPIADYDDLSQLEILPLLDELYDDELELVQDYEDAHRARVAILRRVDVLLAELAEPEPEEEPEAEDEPEVEPIVEEELEPDAAGEEVGEAEALDAANLPIAEYDVLAVSEILPLLAELEDDELEDVRDYEDAYLGRSAIINRIDALLEPYDEPEFEDDDEAEEEVEAEAEDEAEAQGEAAGEEPEDAAPAEGQAPTEEQPAAPPADEEDFVEEEEEEYEEEEEEFADEGDDTFPIADYDDLRVAEILPLLSQLQADELEVVARHEEELANRSTILNRIERLLQLSD